MEKQRQLILFQTPVSMFIGDDPVAKIPSLDFPFDVGRSAFDARCSSFSPLLLR
jgi:hypothetical protein